MANQKYPGLSEHVESCIEQGIPVPEIFKVAVEKFGYPDDPNQFRIYYDSVKKFKFTKVGRVPATQAPSFQNINDRFMSIITKKKSANITELCTNLKCKETDVKKLIKHNRQQGKEILLQGKMVHLNMKVPPMRKAEFNKPIGNIMP